MKSSLLFSAAVLALSLSVGNAVAEGGLEGAPVGPQGRMKHAMRAPAGMFGFEAVKDKLQLTPNQQAQWDAASAQGRAAREAGRQTHHQMQQAMKEELARAEPDLARVAAIADQARAQNESAHRQVRDTWLALYATFTPSQKTVVRDFLVARTQVMEHMRSRFGGGDRQ